MLEYEKTHADARAGFGVVAGAFPRATVPRYAGSCPTWRFFFLRSSIANVPVRSSGFPVKRLTHSVAGEPLLCVAHTAFPLWRAKCRGNAAPVSPCCIDFASFLVAPYPVVGDLKYHNGNISQLFFVELSVQWSYLF